jgi:hypothetical protein
VALDPRRAPSRPLPRKGKRRPITSKIHERRLRSAGPDVHPLKLDRSQGSQVMRYIYNHIFIRSVLCQQKSGVAFGEIGAKGSHIPIKYY